MIFRDFTIVAGAVQSRRVYDTREIAEPALDRCQEMLRELRLGAVWVDHGVEGLPPFGVGLGVPAWLAKAGGVAVESPGRFFRVGSSDGEEFQINLVLGERESSRDFLDLATVMGLSLGFGDKWVRRGPARAGHLMIHERPLLATTFVPVAGLTVGLVKVAADFSTCFAAALLLESNA